MTPPLVSAAAGQATPAISAISVLMAGASGTAVADRDLWNLFIMVSYAKVFAKKNAQPLPFLLLSLLPTCKKTFIDFPVPSREVINQTLPGREF